MITEHDLDTAIAKCQGLADPKPSDAIKLAAFYIIKNEMYGQPSNLETQSYSYAAPNSEPVETIIDYEGDSEFSELIDGRRASDIWPIIDELMDIIRVTTPKLYKGVIRKIQD